MGVFQVQQVVFWMLEHVGSMPQVKSWMSVDCPGLMHGEHATAPGSEPMLTGHGAMIEFMQ